MVSTVVSFFTAYSESMLLSLYRASDLVPLAFKESLVNQLCCLYWSKKGTPLLHSFYTDANGHSSVGVAHTQVLRTTADMCRKLKQDAVPTVAFSSNYSTLSYHLASACDQVYLAPDGDLFFTGTSEMHAYMRSLLDAYAYCAACMLHVTITVYTACCTLQSTATSASTKAHQQTMQVCTAWSAFFADHNVYTYRPFRGHAVHADSI